MTPLEFRAFKERWRTTTNRDILLAIFACVSDVEHENHKLKSRILDLERTIEDVSCGTKLNCTKCGKSMPCLCDKENLNYE